jgi:hypothetical protein
VRVHEGEVETCDEEGEVETCDGEGEGEGATCGDGGEEGEGSCGGDGEGAARARGGRVVAMMRRRSLLWRRTVSRCRSWRESCHGKQQH